MSNWEKRARARLFVRICMCVCVRSCVVRAVLTTFFESTISSTAPLLFQTPRKAKSTTHDDGNFGRRKYYSASCFPALPFFFLCHATIVCCSRIPAGKCILPRLLLYSRPESFRSRENIGLRFPPLVACSRFTRERTHINRKRW